MISHLLSRLVSLALPILSLLTLIGNVQAQDIDPRAFTPAPVDVNFLLLGYGYSDGNVFFDQSLPVDDATGEVHSVGLGYVRTLDFFGATAKLGAVIPFAWGEWEGLWMGEPASTGRRGFGDPMVNLAVNFVGAPALKFKEMRTYREEIVIGAALSAIVPIGQYDPEKLINLGTNRWAFRTRLGASRRIDKWTFGTIGSAWFFTENPDVFGDNSISQDPILAIQFYTTHQFRRGFWAGFGFGYGEGGQTTVSGQEKDTRQINRRVGGMVVYPFDKRHSLKFMYISCLSTRIGADFDRLGISWQMFWGGGL
jgi:hypothetical protein